MEALIINRFSSEPTVGFRDEESSVTRRRAVPKKGDIVPWRIEMEELIRSVKRACHAGLDSVSLRRQVAARVVPRLGFDANAFSTCDPDTSLMAHAVAEGVPHPLAKA